MSAPTEKESQQVALTMASLILHDSGKEINESNLQTLTKAAGFDVSPLWLSVFSNTLDGADLSGILSAPSPTASAGGASAGGDDGAEAGGEEKKVESSSESDDVAAGGLFGDDDDY
mmetsp:Transcript_5915/g.9184  ORF Transcript_5915/g.9184 Transcript_5915/m.9184 type:complete len:116 (+) Transcript_5915:138-485(+)|eukprot:CAMPEP_0201547386 /NCGR_PEP_ID=MMETSP0173_2-20130828/3858_1 /ASSEMBLY_ACC=CAM_ASM_000268 /TAXON_ID=218659 /ORGANISM="Vexillifera sp., Strain DIVA3 564/2" /LENGTH=115 /DNA_ID=CAMNT_0047956415 /DNA_START=45 /DNA_END=392 /DNA_ORIENTATION=-